MAMRVVGRIVKIKKLRNSPSGNPRLEYSIISADRDDVELISDNADRTLVTSSDSQVAYHNVENSHWGTPAVFILDEKGEVVIISW